MIQLTRINFSANMSRFYTLQIAPTLFGEFAVVTEWGRIGSPGTVREQLFAGEQAAVTALDRRTTAKLRRGYRRVTFRTAA